MCNFLKQLSIDYISLGRSAIAIWLSLPITERMDISVTLQTSIFKVLFSIMGV
jgi:hypothetical protein